MLLHHRSEMCIYALAYLSCIVFRARKCNYSHTVHDIEVEFIVRPIQADKKRTMFSNKKIIKSNESWYQVSITYSVHSSVLVQTINSLYQYGHTYSNQNCCHSKKSKTSWYALWYTLLTYRWSRNFYLSMTYPITQVSLEI